MSDPNQPTSKPLEAFLNDYASRLSLSSASKILTLDDTTHATLTAWCKSTLSHVDQPTITPASSNPTTPSTTHPNPPTSWPHPEAAYTHIFATIQRDLKTTVTGLKGIHHSLLWKGVAILLGPEGGEVAGEKVDLGRLVELGGFEPGKIRSVEMEGGRSVCFAMKWDLLTA